MTITGHLAHGLSIWERAQIETDRWIIVNNLALYISTLKTDRDVSIHVGNQQEQNKMAEIRNDAMIHCQGFATDRMIFRDDELSYALGGFRA